MKRAAVAGLVLLALVGAGPAAALEVETLQQTGTSANRFDLVLMGDGYTSAQQAKLTTDANALVAYLFGLTPYKEYKQLFNIKLIHVISAESGADYGAAGSATVNTALGARFNCNGIDRLLCVDTSAVTTVAAQNVPVYDQIVVIVNDTKYGGAGGLVATTSLASSAGEIIRHELGHTIGDTADEYSSPYPQYPACTTATRVAGAGNAPPGATDCPEPNMTVKTTRETVKWKSWIDTTTAVPTATPGGTKIGAYQGGRYQSTLVYRPYDDACLMNKLSRPFCSVCAEAMVRAFWRKAALIDSRSPAGATVNACGAMTFSVGLPPVGVPLQVTWSVDGTAKAGDVTSFSPDAFTPGTHEVRVKVKDPTALVRDDAEGILEQEESWTVNVPSTAGACVANGPCEEAGVCDANGQCVRTLKAVGTECSAAKCSAGDAIAAGRCDTAGTCVAATQVCGAFKCDETQAKCKSACTTADECVAGKVCTNGVCTAPVLIGDDEPPQSDSCVGCSATAGGAFTGPVMLAFAALLRRRRQR